MIDVYLWPTGNGKKITIMLEECQLEYRVHPINIGLGDQHTPDYLNINPNGKIPAIVDQDTPEGPITIFESGAILQYLADKTGELLPQSTKLRYQAIQWLYWQVGGLGPSGGQAHHYLRYSPQKINYAIERSRKEIARLYQVMNTQLQDNQFLAGEYSIADIACWPWIYRHDWQQQNLEDFPHLHRWFLEIAARPAVKKGSSVGSEWLDMNKPMPKEEKKRLFNLSDKDFDNEN